MSNTLQYHLISFKLCPFVQRSVIVLKEKQIPFDITYIDLQKKPDWFLKLSPLGKVPVLQVGETVLFESAVIAEYLDETTPPLLHPADPLQKAQNRAWMEFSSSLIMGSHHLLTANDQEIFMSHRADLKAKLAQVEQVLGEGPFFNGQKFMLIDACFAPFFMRLQVMESLASTELLDRMPRIREWSHALLGRPAVQESVVDNFKQLYIEKVRQNPQSCFTQMAGMNGPTAGRVV